MQAKARLPRTHTAHSRLNYRTFAVLILCAKSSQRTEFSRSHGISRNPASSCISTINGETFATSSGSNSWSFATLNQRAVGSTPTRPTKTINYLGRDTGSHFMGSGCRCYYGVNVIQNVDPMYLLTGNPPCIVLQCNRRLGMAKQLLISGPCVCIMCAHQGPQ